MALKACGLDNAAALGAQGANPCLTQRHKMDKTLVVAMITASITLFGWLVTHILTIHRDRQNQRLSASLKYVERQLEELYGPLAFFGAVLPLVTQPPA